MSVSNVKIKLYLVRLSKIISTQNGMPVEFFIDMISENQFLFKYFFCLKMIASNFKKKIWIKNTFKDDLYGTVIVDAKPNNKHILLECSISSTHSTSSIIKMDLQSMTNINSL